MNTNSRNTVFNRKDFSSNSWKPQVGASTAQAAIDFNSLNNTPPSTAFGTGRFFQGLRGEIDALDKEDLMLSGFEAAKYSSKKNGIITAYGANTNQGIVR